MNTLLIIFRAALFYLVPTLIGYLLYSITEKAVLRKKSVIQKVFTNLETKLLGESNLQSAISFLKLPWFFSIGAIFLLFAATATSAIHYAFLSTIEFKHVFFPIVYTLFFAGGLTVIIRYFRSNNFPSLKELKPVSILVGISLLVAMIWQLKTPYSLNWDLYEHQTVARLIQEGNFKFQTVKISDTFGFSSYPPTFHLLLASSQSLAEESPEEVLLYWQYLGYIHLITVTIASYYVGLAITRNRQVALLSGILGSTIFESVIAFTSLFILPQTLAATVFAASFAGILLTGQKDKGRVPIAVVIILAFSLILMHYIIGTLAAIILLGTYALLYFKPLKSHINIVAIVITAFAIIGSIASYFINLSWINSGEAGSYTFGLAEKFGYALSIYGGSLFIFSALGVFGIYKSNIPHKKIWIILLIGFTALMFSNIPYVLKFYTIGRYFFHALMAVGIALLLKQLRHSWLKNFTITLVVITFISLFALNVGQWKQHVSSNGQYSHISDDDTSAAKYLQEYRKDHHQSMILSDPTTMYLMEGLAGVNSPGGVFATVQTREQLFSALSEKSIPNINDKLNLISDGLVSDSSRFLIISGRTYKWYFASEAERNGFTFNLWKPSRLTFYDRVELDSVISNTTKILYQNPSYVIIKLEK